MGDVPAAPQAITLGRLLRPTRAAATNVRMTGIRYCKRNLSRVMPLICRVTGTAKQGEMEGVYSNCIVYCDDNETDSRNPRVPA